MSTRALAAALFASLAMNLFLGGIVTGEWTRERALPAKPAAEATPGRAAPPSGEAIVRGAVQRLLAHVPAEHRPEVEKRLAARRGEIQRANQLLRATRERLASLAGADPLDRGKLDQIYAELREHNMAVQKAIHLAIGDAIADLPVAARRAIVGEFTGGARR